MDESCGNDGGGGGGTGSKIDKDGEEIDRATQRGIEEADGEWQAKCWGEMVRWRYGTMEDTQDSTE